jgi:hypothetical protein
MRHLITPFFLFVLLNNVSAQNINVSEGLLFDGEPYMIINPKNPQHIVVAWIGYKYGVELGIKTKVSENGGKTWSAYTYLPHFGATFHSADPSMAYDTAGNLFACYIDYTEAPDSGGDYVIESKDGGYTWLNPHQSIGVNADSVKYPIDRPWFTINPANNHFYITSKPAIGIPPPNRPYFVSSVNEGVTWSPWRYIDSTGFFVGPYIEQPMAAPVTSSDGKFHCIYPTWETSQNLLPGFIHAVSSNDGVSFNYYPVGYSSSAPVDTLAKAGYRFSADPTNPNHLVLTFLNTMYGDADVFITESTDGGVTWSSFIRVNDDPKGNGKMQDLAWTNFSSKGDLICGWRDRRDAPGSGYSEPSEIWGAVRWKDSTNFSPNFKISDTLAPFDSIYLDRSGNDFMTIDMVNDTMYAVWGDDRTNTLNIWFAKKALLTNTPTSVQLIATEEFPQISVYPNPATDVINFKGEAVCEAEIYNSAGKLMLHAKLSATSQQLPVQNLPAGVYLIKMETAKGEASFKFTKQ